MGFIASTSAGIRRQPAVPAAVLFILGITAYPILPTVPAVWLAVIAALLIAGITLQKRQTWCCLFIAGAIFMSGVCSGQLSRFNFPRNHIGTFAGNEPRLAWVEGKIIETPRLIEPETGGRPLPEKQKFLIDVRSIRIVRGWNSASGELPVTVSPPAVDLEEGQIVRLLGRIERPEPAMNPGAFNYEEQYRRERVLVTMYVSRPYDVQVLTPAARWAAPIAKFREACRGLLERGFEGGNVDRALLTALVFGDRDRSLRDTSDDFIHSGTTHILAANGARIAMLAGIAFVVLR